MCKTLRANPEIEDKKGKRNELVYNKTGQGQLKTQTLNKIKS